jgi:hypothetical protein
MDCSSSSSSCLLTLPGQLPPPLATLLCWCCRHVESQNEGWQLTQRAMETTVRSAEALPIFDKAIDRFKEVIAAGEHQPVAATGVRRLWQPPVRRPQATY